MAIKLSQPGAAEANLITRSQQGDREAFEKLIIQYQDWVFTHLFRWIGNRHTAEELAQETFLKAFVNLTNFREQAKFSTWLFQIMKNLSHDYWRRKENRQALSQSLEKIKNTPAFNPETEAQLAQSQNKQKIRLIVAKLPAIYREIIMLRYFSEMSYEEMSKKLNLKVSRLKMRVARALELLRKSKET